MAFCASCGTQMADNAAFCPNCGKAIDLRENDRGKTTICPNCKYFLGCVLPSPKHVYRRHGVRR